MPRLPAGGLVFFFTEDVICCMTDQNTVNADAILKKYDRESNTVHYTGWPKKVVAAIAITFSIFQIYTATFGVLDAQLQRAVHLGFGLALAYLLYPFRRAWARDHFFHPIDVAFAILGAAAPAYIVIQYRELVTRAGSVTMPDVIVGGLGILLVIEATRRVVGLPMVTVVLFFLAYAFLGPYMPGVLAHRGLSLEQLVSHLYFTTEGIFGIPLGVSSTFIFLFILFGAYLESTGLGKFFIDLANAVAGWASGGPAKVAVLSSGLMGTVSGSSVANVVGTGSLTIPMMKKLGYDANFAGAVEAAASTGGQLMPPVMGAAAFLMAEFVGVPYIEVVKAAAIPLLYFTGVWLGVHFEAKRKNLRGIPRSELPHPLTLLKERGHLAIPLIVIVYLLVSGYTPMRAALVAIVLSIACAMLRKSTRMKPIEIVYGLERGAKAVLGVLIACAAAGIIIGVVTKTGVGLRLASGLIDAAGGMLLPAMFFTMITAIVLGMGVPTTANYVITSTIAAPALVQMGVPLLAAHMFVFYFGIIADVTPPVALAAYAGAGISGGNPLRTGVHASKLAIAAFIIPYIFVLSPVIMMVDAEPFTLIVATLSALIGMIAVSSALCGFLADHCRLYERVLLIAAGLLMIKPGGTTDMIGLAVFAAILAMQSMRVKKAA